MFEFSRQKSLADMNLYIFAAKKFKWYIFGDFQT